MLIKCHNTVRPREIGTSISEASARVSIFSLATQRGKHESPCRQGHSDKSCRLRPGRLEQSLSLGWMIALCDVILTLPACVRGIPLKPSGKGVMAQVPAGSPAHATCLLQLAHRRSDSGTLIELGTRTPVLTPLWLVGRAHHTTTPASKRRHPAGPRCGGGKPRRLRSRGGPRTPAR